MSNILLVDCPDAVSAKLSQLLGVSAIIASEPFSREPGCERISAGGAVCGKNEQRGP